MVYLTEPESEKSSAQEYHKQHLSKDTIFAKEDSKSTCCKFQMVFLVQYNMLQLVKHYLMR
jgi:hypothetical protein